MFAHLPVQGSPFADVIGSGRRCKMQRRAGRQYAEQEPCDHFGISAKVQTEPPAGTLARRLSPENSE